jgi:diguanylate cyclase (GGDEF)-like protein
MSKSASGPAVVALLGVGGLLGIAYFLVPSPLDGLFYTTVPGLSAAVVFAQARNLSRRLPWHLLGWGLVASCAAEAIWFYYETTSGVPWPSFADVFYIGSYPLVAAGLLIFTRDRNPDRDRGSLIDASIITMGLGLVVYHFFIAPYVSGPSLPIVELAISTAYPLMDILLLAVIARALVGGELRNMALGMLLVGTLATLIADCVFAWQEFTTGYSKGLVDAGWIAQYLLWGAAILHPSARRISERAGDGTERLTSARLVLLATSSLLPITILFSSWLGGSGLQLVPEITITTMVMFVLVVARMAGLNGQIRRQVQRLSDQEARLRQALEERELLAERLRHQAFHDTLTGLANRALFMEELENSLSSGDARARGVAVLFLDLDNLKEVNDSLGHACGDELLLALSGRIKGVLRHGDVAARLGGDEFGMIVHDVNSEAEAESVAARVIAALRSPISIQGTTLQALASVGVALGTTEVRQPEDLIRNADAAMYLAKRRGKGCFEVFSGEVAATAH